MNKNKILIFIALVFVLLVGCSKVNKTSIDDDLKSKKDDAIVISEVKEVKEVKNDTIKHFNNFNDEFEIDGEMSIELNEIYLTDERNYKYDVDYNDKNVQFTSKKPDNVYVIKYTYKNISDSRVFDMWPTKVTSNGELGYTYPLVNIKPIIPISSGESLENGEYGFGFDSENIKEFDIHFEFIDKNNKKHEIIYNCNLDNI